MNAEIKERPILFTAAMVRALLDGSKTQTRRIVKPGKLETDSSEYGFFPSCPHGKSGDRLWVRESFWGCDLPGYGDQPCVVYDDEWTDKEYQPAKARPWAQKFGRIPSIHMPRDCSRILLEIASVRVERLQDISDEDALAEGIYPTSTGLYSGAPKAAFKNLWESISGPGSWDANPWVWAIEFRRMNHE